MFPTLTQQNFASIALQHNVKKLTPTLLDGTKALLDRALEIGWSMRQIASPNSHVEYEWLKKFVQQKSKNPSVTRIQALHDHLLTLSLYG